MEHAALKELEKGEGLARISGAGRHLRRVRDEVQRVAPLASTVLLTGETGTGKTQVAKAIHEISPRSGLGFVHVDCAALSASLIESELFGHDRGAFTSAVERRIGRFERAGEGTIFLDEIGDLDGRLQAKLLRVLEDREFERVGGGQTLPMRARVLAATSRDLESAVRDGKFRADLYYRLDVFRVHMAPLRERAEEIPALTTTGLLRAARRLKRPLPSPTDSFLAGLEAHSWPGNVRELMNVLERVVARATCSRVDASSLDGVLDRAGGARARVARAGAVGRAPANAPKSLADLLEEIGLREREEILEALAWSGGNVSAAARRLRIPRSTLRHRLQRLEDEEGPPEGRLAAPPPLSKLSSA